MAREKKAETVDSLQALLAESSMGVITDYRGLNTTDMNVLRRKLRDSGVGYRVVKNTLARLAAKRAGKEALAGSFRGPVALATSQGEINVAPREIVDYIRTTKANLTITSGFLGDRVLTPREVETLAILPTRDVLLSQVMAGMQSPIISLVSVLAGPIRGVMGVLQARIQQLEGQ